MITKVNHSMQALFKNISSLSTFYFLLILSLIFFVGFIGCNNNTKDLNKEAQELSENYKSWEDKFNALSSELESKGCEINEAQNFRNNLKNINNEIQTNLKKDFITDNMLAGWKKKLADCENDYNKLKRNCSKPKDTDNDGVPDNIDECKEKGIKPHGCPDPDKDGFYNSDDGTKVDKCPNEKGIAAKKGCPKKDGPKPPPPPGPKKPKLQDTDGDGVYDMFDDCPNDYGFEEYKGCPPPPPPPPDSDNDGYIDSNDQCPKEKGIAPDGCPIKCTSLTRFVSIKLAVECKKEVKAGILQIKPAIDLVLEDFRLMGGNTNGKINYYVKENVLNKTLNTITESRINSGPDISQIMTSDLPLKAGRTYQLMVETQSNDLTLIGDSCSNTNNFSNSNVELIFTNEPFIHQITFCKK